MKRTTWMKDSIRVGREFKIRNQDIKKHNLINFSSAILLWSLIVSLMLLPKITPWYSWPLFSIALGACFFGHFILIIHECSHSMFVHLKDSKANRKWNGRIGRIASIPFFTDYVRHWEVGHITHHMRPCEKDDPQNPDPLYGTRLLKKFAIIWLIPGGFLTANPSAQYPDRVKRTLIGILCFAPATVFLFNYHWQTIVILCFSFNILSTLNLCKIAQEHGAGLANEPDPLLRSRSYFYPLQFIFSPFNIHYHYEHHANLHVPWYLLPKYHKILLNILPEEVQPYYFHKEYFAQLLGTKTLPPRELIGITKEVRASGT
jgi:fatty acid desaturase